MKTRRTTNKGLKSVHPKIGAGERMKRCALGHGAGAYMPEGHDHEAWFPAKKEKEKKWATYKCKLDDKVMETPSQQPRRVVT